MLTPKQRKKFENIEIIEQSGQEDEQRAIKAIQYLSRQWESEEARKKTNILEELENRKKFNDYIPLLAKICAGEIEEQALEKETDWHVFYDKVGIIIQVTLKGRLFRKAFRASRQPIYDFNACQRFARKVADLESKLKEKEPKIFLPNGQSISQ